MSDCAQPSSRKPVAGGSAPREGAIHPHVLHEPRRDVAGLRTALHGLAPADFLRATRRETTDSFEQRLLAVGDQTYGLLVDIVRQWFEPQEDFVIIPFQDWARRAMTDLDDIHRLLVQRGLLPRFLPA